jgi:hypothetical protein
LSTADPLAPLSLTAWAILFAVIATCLVGCGGGSTFAREDVEAIVSQIHREQLDEGWTMDNAECVQDGDETHWKCLAYVRDAENVLWRLSTDVTCDLDSEECLSEPSGLQRSG